MSRALEERSIFPENTRIRKVASTETSVFEVLQASIEDDVLAHQFSLPDAKDDVRLVSGDHAEELKHICSLLAEASEYAAKNTQKELILNT